MASAVLHMMRADTTPCPQLGVRWWLRAHATSSEIRPLTPRITGSATRHEVPIVRRDQRPGTASTPSSFVALEDDMSGARTGDGITTCIAGSSPSTRDQLTFCLVVQRRRDGPPTHHGRQGLLWTDRAATAAERAHAYAR